MGEKKRKGNSCRHYDGVGVTGEREERMRKGIKGERKLHEGKKRKEDLKRKQGKK